MNIDQVTLAICDHQNGIVVRELGKVGETCDPWLEVSHPWLPVIWYELNNIAFTVRALARRAVVTRTISLSWQARQFSTERECFHRNLTLGTIGMQRTPRSSNLPRRISDEPPASSGQLLPHFYF